MPREPIESWAHSELGFRDRNEYSSNVFGLGMMELIVIVGAVVLLFGASGAKKMLATARSVRDAKRDITSGAVLKRLVDDPPADSKNSKSD